MTDTALPVALTLTSGVERMFPTLTPAQVKRIAVHGQVRSIRLGEVLIEAGEQVVPFFVVTAGRIEIVRPSGTAETLVAVHGPGLAAAVYAASEGLNVLVLETNSPGGQAGSSSKIENYLGFPTGISGQALAGRAYTQAQKFGAQVIIAKGAERLVCDRKPYVIEMDGDTRVQARTIIIASGAEYRQSKTYRSSKALGCTTARHSWKRSCAVVKRSLWWAEVTRPAKPRCFWPRLRNLCTCSCGGTVWPKACRAI